MIDSAPIHGIAGWGWFCIDTPPAERLSYRRGPTPAAQGRRKPAIMRDLQGFHGRLDVLHPVRFRLCPL